MDVVEVGKFQENSGDRLETTAIPIFLSLGQKRPKQSHNSSPLTNRESGSYYK